MNRNREYEALLAAKTEGLTRYKSTRPCKKCGTVRPERQTSNQGCRVCLKHRVKQMSALTRTVLPPEETPTTKAEAIRLRSKFYRPVERCKHGHLGLRRTSTGACVKCLQAAKRVVPGYVRLTYWVEPCLVDDINRYAAALLAARMLELPDTHPLIAAQREMARPRSGAGAADYNPGNRNPDDVPLK